MITGDHPTTAAAIARELGIPDSGPVLTGAELDTLPEKERVERISRTTVFARVSPEHKVRIVQALRQAGRVVAMTGDGVNDAAAIRLADVGIGLSAHGSTSARAAADLVLTDPDPTRILDALREGRALWRSVRDAVAILVGGNAGEVAFTVLGAAVAGRAPLGTRQLLLVNLLTDMLPALAVALARAREDTAGEGPAGEDPLAGGPSPALLGSDLGRILAVRGTATALGAAAAWTLRADDGPGPAGEHHGARGAGRHPAGPDVHHRLAQPTGAGHRGGVGGRPVRRHRDAGGQPLLRLYAAGAGGLDGGGRVLGRCDPGRGRRTAAALLAAGALRGLASWRWPDRELVAVHPIFTLRAPPACPLGPGSGNGSGGCASGTRRHKVCSAQ